MTRGADRRVAAGPRVGVGARDEQLAAAGTQRRRGQRGGEGAGGVVGGKTTAATTATTTGGVGDMDIDEEVVSGFDTRQIQTATDFELPDYWDEGEPLAGREAWPLCATLNIVRSSS